MLACSTHHYDSVCARYALEWDEWTRKPGLIYGMINAMKGGFGGSHTLTFCELDTLAKILEVGQYFPEREKGSQAFSLNFAIRAVLRELNESGVEPKVI